MERAYKILRWLVLSFLNFVITWIILILLILFFGMIIRSFFSPQVDHEKVDTKTVITVPEQSLTVRDILTRFSRGQMDIPPIDYGDDDDINAQLSDYDDLVDAHDDIANAQYNIDRLKESAQQAENNVEQSETNNSAETADDLKG